MDEYKFFGYKKLQPHKEHLIFYSCLVKCVFQRNYTTKNAIKLTYKYASYYNNNNCVNPICSNSSDLTSVNPICSNLRSDECKPNLFKPPI